MTPPNRASIQNSGGQTAKMVGRQRPSSYFADRNRAGQRSQRQEYWLTNSILCTCDCVCFDSGNWYCRRSKSELPPVIRVQPQAVAVNEGSSVHFAASVQGLGPLVYNWEPNRRRVSGPPLTVETMQPSVCRQLVCRVLVIIGSSCGTPRSGHQCNRNTVGYPGSVEDKVSKSRFRLVFSNFEDKQKANSYVRVLCDNGVPAKLVVDMAAKSPFAVVSEQSGWYSRNSRI